MSNVSIYQSNLIQYYESFLIKNNRSDKTRINYKSDIKHFLSWITDYFQHQSIIPCNESQYLSFITNSVIDTYINSQLSQNIPTTTINRRLSSIRNFFEFALNTNMSTYNPIKKIKNIIVKDPDNKSNIIDNFVEALIDEGASKSTIRNYTTDVEQFIKWINEVQPKS